MKKKLAGIFGNMNLFTSVVFSSIIVFGYCGTKEDVIIEIMMIMEKESRLRSILKAISWRAIATATTFTLAYTIFSSSGCEDALEKSSLVAALELVIKLVIYYFHERMWQAIPRGTVRRAFPKWKA